MDSPAAILLKRAITLENESRLQPALVCYQEGIDMLMKMMKECKDSSLQKKYRDKVTQYMERAEIIKLQITKLKEAGKYHEQIRIDDGTCGFGYDSIFGSYLDETVSEVLVEDPYIRNFHQVNNFLRFCELLVLKCQNLKTVVLNTSSDDHSREQEPNLVSIRSSLAKRDITLKLNFVQSLHDREIRLSNGWIVKIGRGLDYFKKVDKFQLGFHEMNLRPCHETTVDIFHSKNMRNT